MINEDKASKCIEMNKELNEYIADYHDVLDDFKLKFHELEKQK
jgi:hypothetical protein